MKKEIKSKVIKSSLIISTSAVALSPIGITLINNLKNKLFSNIEQFDQISNINTPEKEMFYIKML